MAPEAGKHSGWNKEIKVIRKTQDGIGILQLASLFVCNTEVKNLTDLQNLTVKIPSRISDITRDHIRSNFRLEGKTIPVSLQVLESLPLQIAEEETKEISLKVNATTQYKEWNAKLKITREKKDDSTDPELNLENLKIAGEDVHLWHNLDNLSVMVSHKVAKVRKSDVEAVFSLNGEGKQVAFTIEPKVLELDYDETKALTITVPAKKGEYKKWSYNVRITRREIPEDPTPILSDFTVCEVGATKIAENEYFVTVPHKFATITQKHIKTMFQLNHETKNLKVKMEGLPLSLEAGMKGTVSLSVEAVKGKYKAWGPVTLTIKRDIDNPDPELELIKPSFYIDSQRDTPKLVDDSTFKVEVHQYKSRLERNDIHAQFQVKKEGKYSTVDNVELKVVETLPIELEQGVEKTITLLVEAKKGEYREWRRTLKITRYKPLPRLKLNSLKVCGKDAKKESYWSSEWTVEVPQDITTVNENNFEYEFELEGKPKTVKLNVENLPRDLQIGQTETFSCFVERKEKEYERWEGQIKVTRVKTLPNLELRGLTVCGVPADKQVASSDKVWNVEIPGYIDTVQDSHIECSFYLEGSSKNVPVHFEDLPLNIRMGETKEVSFYVNRGEGKYNRWDGGRINITRKRAEATGVVIAVEDQDGENLNLTDESSGIRTFQTSCDNVTVRVNLESSSNVDEIKAVMINSQSATLAPNGRTAEANIESPASNTNKKVSIQIDFEGYPSITREFKLHKLDETQAPLKLRECSLILYDENSEDWTATPITAKLQPNQTNIVYELDEVPYSCAKLKMTFNTSLNSARITNYEDDRSPDYATNPEDGDLEGIFSGRIVKTIDADGRVTTLQPIDPANKKVYTEYVIAGYGTVKYRIYFENVAGQDETYTIVIVNNNENTYEGSSQKQVVISGNGHTKKLEKNTFGWVGGYTKETDWTDSTPYSTAPEYMGDKISFEFKENRQSPDLYFYYSKYTQTNNMDRHEFVRIRKQNTTSGSNGEHSLKFSFDPENAYIDAFLATKSNLPILLYPKYLRHKWTKVLDKGFRLWLSNKYTENSDGTYTDIGKKVRDCLYMRGQTQIYKNNQDRSNVEPLKLGKKQTYQNWLSNTHETLENDTYLSGLADETKDLFILYPTFAGNEKINLADHITSFTCSIKKGKDKQDSEWEDVEDEWKTVSHSLDGKNFIVIGGKDDCIGSDHKVDRSKVFSFIDGEVYKVEVEITLTNGTKEYFDYQFYYTDDDQSMPIL